MSARQELARKGMDGLSLAAGCTPNDIAVYVIQADRGPSLSP